MADRWLGVVVMGLMGTGCAGLVGIEDWGGQSLGPEDASGQVGASSAGPGGSGSASAGTAGAASSSSSGEAGASPGGGGAGGAGGEAGGATTSSSAGGSGPCDGAADGASCGPKASDRCCGEVCVDISSDTMHCGGCDTPCAAGKLCEPVDEAACGAAPADTAGRCTCTTNAQCPHQQACDTTRCSPDSAANCDGVFVDVASCPNYCAY